MIYIYIYVDFEWMGPGFLGIVLSMGGGGGSAPPALLDFPMSWARVTSSYAIMLESHQAR